MLYFQLAGVSIKVTSELPLSIHSFLPKFQHFQIDQPGDDVIHVHHRIAPQELLLPHPEPKFVRRPYAIYQIDGTWIFDSILSQDSTDINRRFICKNNFNNIEVLHRDDYIFQNPLQSLTAAVTDQLIFINAMAQRQATFFHASGIKYKNKGFMFLGQSEAGKSTMIKLTQAFVKPLCDERIIVRKWPDGFRIHGTWSHGELPIVSADEAPLQAMCFIHKAKDNYAERISADQALAQILPRIARTLPDTDWWEKQLHVVESILQNVLLYNLYFDKSGQVMQVIDELANV